MTTMDIRTSNDEALRVLNASVDGVIEILQDTSDEVLKSARCNTGTHFLARLVSLVCVVVVLTCHVALCSGCTSLHWAAGSGQMEVILYLVQDRLVSVNIRATKKARGRTPLHYACRNGYLEAAKLLVKLGADMDARAKHDVSPFQLAVWQNHMDVCRWLVGSLHLVSSCAFYPTNNVYIGGGKTS